MSSLTQSITALIEDFERIAARLDLPQTEARLNVLQAETTAPNFWNNDREAKEIMQQVARLSETVSQCNSLKADLDNLLSLDSLVDQDQDQAYFTELQAEVNGVAKRIAHLKLQSYLSGKYDSSGAIIGIHAGQGGVEAMDWAQMLGRMYTRYLESTGKSYQLIEQTSGEEAGIKSMVLLVTSSYAYGYFKGEAGTHRLVRQSPFNADNLRQTSFALVEVVPLIEASQVDIKDEDLEWQFFRSGGAGGQNVNKVNTAVRVRHIPSGVTVVASSKRTQIDNRKVALEILQSKLEQLEQERHESEAAHIKGDYKPAGWGQAVRSYVLHPYQLVKDNRSGYESTDAFGVLEGDLDGLLEAGIASSN